MAKRARALNRERVLQAALELADASGLEALSMRQLGQVLGVEAMSLYNHVENKDALLDGMLEAVLAEAPLPDPGGGWETELRRCAVAMHTALHEHPWACALVMAPARFPRTLAARMRYIEALLATLRAGGFTAEQAYHGYHAIDAHTVGFTMWELGHAVPDEAIVDDVRREVASGAYPYLSEHAREHEADHRSAFEFGLDLIFDGLRRMRDAPL